MFRVSKESMKSRHFEEYLGIVDGWWSKEEFFSDIAMNTSELFCFFDSNEVIGGFILTKDYIDYFEKDENKRLACNLMKDRYNMAYLILKEEYRGKKTGSMLLQAFLDETEVNLWAAVKKERVLFYKRLGFSCINEKAKEGYFLMAYEKG